MAHPNNTPALGWTVTYVSNVEASVTLYEEAFGLITSFVHPAGDFAQFDTGTTALALCATSLAGESTLTDLSSRVAPTGNITLVYDDVETAFTRAIAAGAGSLVSPATKPWGQISSYVTDLDGNLIEIASVVADE